MKIDQRPELKNLSLMKVFLRTMQRSIDTQAAYENMATFLSRVCNACVKT